MRGVDDAVSRCDVDSSDVSEVIEMSSVVNLVGDVKPVSKQRLILETCGRSVTVGKQTSCCATVI